MSTGKFRNTLFVCLFSALLIFIGAPLKAQQATATLGGTVTDPSGAAVPDAMVTVTNVGTGNAQTAVTDAQGRYKVADLPIGNYDIQVEKAGFQTAIHKGIQLSIGSDSVVDFALPIGQVAQTVTVEGQVSQVETTSSTISTLVEQSQIRELPLNGRNFEQLILLAPGVSSIGNVSKGLYYGNSNAFSVSGSRANGQAELLDDTDVQDYMNRGSGAGVLGTSMGVDAIAEFQTLTNTYGAQFGGNGAVVNEVSKSGTNSFHGSAYEFVRDSALDARNFFDPATIPPFTRNQFGATLGGPIKKDKMFFFFNYEGLRQNLGESVTATVPDLNARNGYYVASNGTLTCATNSGITRPAGTQTIAGSCPINSNIAPYLAFYPAPPAGATEVVRNGIATGTDSFINTGQQAGSENYFLGRYDWTISAKDSIFARYLGDKATLFEPFEAAPSATSSLTLWPTNNIDHNQFATVEEKHIFSNSVINTIHFGYSRPLEISQTTASYGPAQVPGSAVGFEFYKADGLYDTDIGVGGLSTLGPYTVNPIRLMENKFATGDDVLWSKGAHTLHIGGSITELTAGTKQLFPGGGTWTFPGLQAFLQDAAQQFSGPIPSSQSIVLTNGQKVTGTDGQRDFRQKDYVLYAQDDWKIRPTLTINLGIRWEPQSNPTEINSKLTAITALPFGLGAVPCSPAGTATCSVIGTTLATGFSPVTNVYAKNPSWHNIDPRIGIAWDPFKDHKTSIRAGYGIFYSPIVTRDYAAGYYFTPPWATGVAQNPTFPIFPNLGGSPNVNFGFNRFITQTPYMQQWNLSLQRELMKNTVLTLSYVGSHGVHNLNELDENPPTYTIDPTNGQQVFSHLVGNSVVSNPVINSHFGFIDAAEADAWSKYNALQVSVIRRLTNNLQAQLSYTYAECTDPGSGSWSTDAGTNYSNPYNPNQDEGWCSFYIRNNLIANSMYILPFHGNRLVEGWQIGGIFSYHTGIPVNITDGVIWAFQNGTTANRPNYAPNAPGCNNNPINSQIEQGSGVFYVNTACFALPPVGENGNLARNAIIGPSFKDLDASLLKTTRITERLTVQLRAEFFNVLNNVNFQQPAAGMFNGFTVTSPTTGIGTVSPTAGKITATANNSRQIQFGVKFLF